MREVVRTVATAMVPGAQRPQTPNSRAAFALGLAVVLVLTGGVVTGICLASAAALRAVRDQNLTRPVGDTILLAVDGMVCGGCAGDVRRELEEIAGVREAEIDLERGTALVTLAEPYVVDPMKLVETLNENLHTAQVLELGRRTEPGVIVIQPRTP
ncbi:hypothetical protein BH11PLA1_BH11PLA1_22000 [soil metagenome]